MSLSRQEQTLTTATVLVVLFGLLGFKLRDGLDAWRDRLDRLDGLRRNRAEARELISMGPQWSQKYEEIHDQMPVFEPGRQVDTYWMSKMDELARTYDVSITRRQVGRETLVGDVYEFTTECQWEGPLDAVSKFLCAMQEAGAMLDVRDFVVRTQSAKKGFLRGSFILHCAYMRGEPAPAEPAPAPTREAGSVPEASAPGSPAPSAPPSPTSSPLP